MAINYSSVEFMEDQLLSIFDLVKIRELLSDPRKYDWYAAQVLRLCAKADETNIVKLASIYPDAVAAIMIYWTGAIPEKYRDMLPHWQYYERKMIPLIFPKG